MAFAKPLLLTLLPAWLCAQSPYPNVRIDDQSEEWYSYPPCEPSICINPADPSVIVAGAILNAVYLSTDTGATWSRSVLESPHGVFGDPCVIANRRGDFYYCHLADPEGTGWKSESLLESIVCQRSRDFGKTWSKGAAAGKNGTKDQDKEWAVASPDSRHVYMSWTEFDKYESPFPSDSSRIMFSRARRSMRRWKKPVVISERSGDCADDDGTVEGAVPAAGPGNDVYVAWALGETIWFDRSSDRGRTWLKRDIAAARIAGGWNQQIPGIMRANGMPVLVCDLSAGPRHGRLYICWSDMRHGTDDCDVFVTFSDDRGDTWATPVRVNDDAGTDHQFFPWIAVDQATGALHVVFYDRRRGEGWKTDVFLASSFDGGLSWTNQRISESPFTPSDQVFFGDYSNISAFRGIVRPIWTRCDSNRLSIWTALIHFR